MNKVYKEYKQLNLPEINKEIFQEWMNLGSKKEVTLEETGRFASKGYSLPAFSACIPAMEP